MPQQEHKPPRVIDAVVVGWRPDWHKWPDTADTEYGDVMSLRVDVPHEVDGEPVTVRLRRYPIHHAFVRAGMSALPMPHPWIDNTKLPAPAVCRAMLLDLEELARDGCKLCFWEHAFHCYPVVAARLKELFAHSVFVFCDDCPGATGIKSMPVAAYFDTVLHGNVLCAPTGARTRDLYLRLGVADVQYIALATTAGFARGLRKATGCAPGEPDEAVGSAPLRYGRPSAADSLDLAWRMQQLRDGRYSSDVVFVGGCLGEHRAYLNSLDFSNTFSRFGLRSRIVGYGMRDGILQPRVLEGMGEPVAKLYLDSFATVNPRTVGLMGTRPYDAWASGTLLFQHDPAGELAALNVQAGKHYVECDGTALDLCTKVRHYQQHMDEAASILRAGKIIGEQLAADNSIWHATRRVLQRNRGKFGL